MIENTEYKKQVVRVIIVLIITTINYSYADGPPISGNNFRLPHFTFHLNELQILEAGAKREVTLNSRQHALLQKLTKIKLPLQIPIITYPYKDCSCGMAFYGLWSKPDEIQVDTSRFTDSYIGDTTNYNLSATKLNLDTNLEVYYLGHKISTIQLVAKNIKISGKKSLFINTPPILSYDHLIKINNKLFEIDSLFNKYGISTGSFYKMHYKTDLADVLKRTPVLSTIVLEDQDRIDYIINENSGYKINASASSHLVHKNQDYGPGNLIDDDNSNTWSEGVPGYGYSEKIYFTNVPTKPNGYMFINGYAKSDKLYYENSRIKKLIIYVFNSPLYVVKLHDTPKPQYLMMKKHYFDIKGRISYRIAEVYKGSKYEDTCLSLLMPTFNKIKYDDLNK